MFKAEPWLKSAALLGANAGSFRPSRPFANLIVGSLQDPRSRAISNGSEGAWREAIHLPLRERGAEKEADAYNIASKYWEKDMVTLAGKYVKKKL